MRENCSKVLTMTTSQRDCRQKEASPDRNVCPSIGPRLIAYQWKRIAEPLIEPEFESMAADRQFGSDPLLVLFGARAVWATIWHSWLSLQLARRRFASPS